MLSTHATVIPIVYKVKLKGHKFKNREIKKCSEQNYYFLAIASDD